MKNVDHTSCDLPADWRQLNSLEIYGNKLLSFTRKEFEPSVTAEASLIRIESWIKGVAHVKCSKGVRATSASSHALCFIIQWMRRICVNTVYPSGNICLIIDPVASTQKFYSTWYYIKCKEEEENWEKKRVTQHLLVLKIVKKNDKGTGFEWTRDLRSEPQMALFFFLLSTLFVLGAKHSTRRADIYKYCFITFQRLAIL